MGVHSAISKPGAVLLSGCGLLRSCGISYGWRRHRCAALPQLAVILEFMQKASGQHEGRFVELELGGYVGRVEDGVAKLHEGVTLI